MRRVVADIAVAERYTGRNADKAAVDDVADGAADHEFQRAVLDYEHGLGALVDAGRDLNVGGDGVGMRAVSQVCAVGVRYENDLVAREEEGLGHLRPICSGAP